ncbi:MAG: SDR family NAD(P)-dependent oxidoreductase [Halieaceae bacterium]|jgi:short-subunit dehydrogenase|nr:SDR family NAD(P)-dependent oxidoreductase [Halieaceae bacterium]
MTTRTALITGASAGLGLEFARQLGARGYRLVLVARNPERLQAAATELDGTAGDAPIRCISADLGDPAAPAALVRQLQDEGIEIDYLVNNAGIAGPNLLEPGDWQEHRDFYQLMMLSIAELCHRLIPPMQARGFGRVINVASVAGRLARAGGCNYGPSKAWVIALSEELALTVAGDGVKVSALCPGFTHTEFHERAGLMDMKNASPSWLWYDAETVVREGLAAVERGKSVYCSGRLYRWLDPLLQSVWTRRLFSLSDGR